MEALEFWKLNEFFTVRDISLLIIDEDPSDYGSQDDDWLSTHKKGFLPLSTALKNAVEQNKIKSKIRYDVSEYGIIDWSCTELEVESIKEWIKSKNLKTDFFYDFDEETEGEKVFITSPVNPFEGNSRDHVDSQRPQCKNLYTY